MTEIAYHCGTDKLTPKADADLYRRANILTLRTNPDKDIAELYRWHRTLLRLTARGILPIRQSQAPLSADLNKTV